MKTDGKMEEESNFFLALLECHSISGEDLRTVPAQKERFINVGKLSQIFITAQCFFISIIFLRMLLLGCVSSRRY